MASNALALRLGDEKFACEIYDGLLAQAIRTPERWSDVDINVRLSCIQERVTSGDPRSERKGVKPQAAAAGQADLFDAVVTWEYTVVPSAQVRKFVATADLEEFRELITENPMTTAWFLSPESGANPADLTAFELMSFSVDGRELQVRRRARRSAQTYSVDLGVEVLATARPVRIRQVYRTVSRRSGHRFRVALTQPTHGLRLTLDYTDTDIAELKVGELVASATPAAVKHLPASAPAKQVEVSVPGWILPQAEVSFVWTLAAEQVGPSTAQTKSAA